MMRQNTNDVTGVTVGLVVILAIIASAVMWNQRALAETFADESTRPTGQPDPSFFAVQPSQDTNQPARPGGQAWYVGSFQLGGQWLTNPPVLPAMQSFSEAWWVPSETPEGVGSLFLLLDRGILTNDLVMELTLLDNEGSSLYVDLLATNFVTVSTNLCGNLIEGSNEVVCLEVPLILSHCPSASIIRLWRGKGEVLVYEAALKENTGIDVATDNTFNTMHSSMETASTEQGSLSSLAEQPGENTAVSSAETNSGSVATNGISPLPRPMPPRLGHVVYVVQDTGDDSFTGNSLVRVGNDGPKKTIKAGLAACRPGSILQIKEGRYGEDLNVAGRSVSVHVEGNVDLSGHFRPPAEVVILPDGVTTNMFK